jgi:hypothetical protein
MNAILSCWHYESDGDSGDRTYYAVRDSADSPCGIVRIDFDSDDKARKFVKESNGLLNKPSE